MFFFHLRNLSKLETSVLNCHCFELSLFELSLFELSLFELSLFELSLFELSLFRNIFLGRHCPNSRLCQKKLKCKKYFEIKIRVTFTNAKKSASNIFSL